VRGSRVKELFGISWIFGLPSRGGPIGEIEGHLIGEVAKLLSERPPVDGSGWEPGRSFAFCNRLEHLEFSGALILDVQTLLELLRLRQSEYGTSNHRGNILTLENCFLPGPGFPDDPEDLYEIPYGADMGYFEARQLLEDTLHETSGNKEERVDASL